MQDKVVIVTGGSRGIGASIVKTLARKGYNIILNYNKSEKIAEQIKKELEEKNIDFNMNFNSIKVNMGNISNYCLIKVAVSKTILPFYLVCLVTTLIIYFIKF